MRISDWSSDVCSSDLCAPVAFAGHPQADGRHRRRVRAKHPWAKRDAPNRWNSQYPGSFRRVETAFGADQDRGACGRGGQRVEKRFPTFLIGEDQRSEEHTSELQSLMRISYAVFCLKKKQHKNTKSIKHNIQNKSST